MRDLIPQSGIEPIPPALKRQRSQPLERQGSHFKHALNQWFLTFWNHKLLVPSEDSLVKRQMSTVPRWMLKTVWSVFFMGIKECFSYLPFSLHTMSTHGFQDENHYIQYKINVKCKGVDKSVNTWALAVCTRTCWGGRCAGPETGNPDLIVTLPYAGPDGISVLIYKIKIMVTLPRHSCGNEMKKYTRNHLINWGVLFMWKIINVRV